MDKTMDLNERGIQVNTGQFNALDDTGSEFVCSWEEIPITHDGTPGGTVLGLRYPMSTSDGRRVVDGNEVGQFKILNKDGSETLVRTTDPNAPWGFSS